MDANESVDEALSRNEHAPAFEEIRKNDDEVTSLMEMARKLCLVEDPPTEPFRSKYKAREAFLKARQCLLRDDGSDGGGVAGSQLTASADRVAVIDYHLGVIALAVEENSAAQEALDKCAGVFFEGVVSKIAAAAGNEEDENDGQSPPPPPIPTEAPPGMISPRSVAWDYPAEAGGSLTQLGLLWSSRGYPRRSILYLLASVDFLREASSSPSSRSPTPVTPPSPSLREEKDGDNRNGDEGEKEGVACVVPVDVGGIGGGDGTAAVAGAGEGRAAERKTVTREEGEARRKGGGERKSLLESMLTHSFYYLAQAYGVRNVEQSAKYCALTLQRQLDASQRGDGVKVSFDPGEWSRNACFLAEYYSGLKRFQEAGRCLLAAQAVLQPEGTAARATRANGSSPLPPPPDGRGREEDRGVHQKTSSGDQEGSRGNETPDGGEGKETETELAETAESSGAEHQEKEEEEAETEEVREQRREQRADVDRHLAKLYITVLQAKHQEQSKEGGGGFPKVRRQEKEEKEGPGLRFTSLGIGELPMCDPAAVPGNFESVREVFKRAKSHTERALRHYVLDGFVTAHVALQQGMSRAYLYLSGFERDTKRRQAMCTRRAQLLEPLLSALAPKAYERLHKELSFELGEIYQDLADLEVLRVDEKVSTGATKAPIALASDLRATARLLKSAIGFFSHFVAMYHEGDPGAGAADSPSQPAKGMETMEVVGYLQARFLRARLNGKLRHSNSEKELQALRLSCGEFAWLSEHARGHLKSVRETAGDPRIFEEELELAEEMMQLQRRTIANLERKMEEQKRALKQ